MTNKKYHHDPEAFDAFIHSLIRDKEQYYLILDEESHLMENAIYNELLVRGYNVDVGIVEIREKNRRMQTEVDFVCNQGSNRYYIQSALTIDTQEKTSQESRPLNNIKDSFKKIIVVKENIKPWHTEDGILVIGLLDFLLDEHSLEK